MSAFNEPSKRYWNSPSYSKVGTQFNSAPTTVMMAEPNPFRAGGLAGGPPVSDQLISCSIIPLHTTVVLVYDIADRRRSRHTPTLHN